MAARHALVLHPRYEALLAEREALRTRVAELLERLQAQAVEAEILEARLGTALGPAEIERLQARAEHAALRRALQAATALANRGASLDGDARERIEAAAAAERARWTERIAQEQSRVGESLLFQCQLAPVSPGVLEEARELYRRLCRRLHPDLLGAEHPAYRRYWALMQQAYRHADLELLRALDQLVPRVRAGPGDGWQALQQFIAALRRRERELLGRIAANLQRPPLCHARELQDPAWIEARAAAIHAETHTLHQLTTTLGQRLAGLLSGQLLH
jgi:hypothetical protein